MTNQETIDFNNLCAEFVGGIYSPHAEAWGFGEASIIPERKFLGTLYKNVVQAQRFEKDLKFHSDWNLIEEVMETILNLDFVIKITSSKSLSKDRNLHKVTIQRNLVKDLWNDFYIVEAKDYNTKKEAVVEAIQHFILWHKNDK